MRKIKITALILAVLMVMAAFAGCASKSTVEDLDDRVSALEEAINANQKANEEKISELATLIEALTKSQADIKDSVDANKTAQDASNQAILDAIKDLGNKVEAVEKEQDNTVKVDTTLAALKQEKITAIAIAKATYEAKKDNYTEADYEALAKALATAEIEISNAATVAAVNEIYAAMEAEVAKYAQVDDYVYAQVKAYRGNITADSEDAIEALVEYVEDVASVVYADNMSKLTKYVYGQDKNGKNLTINLVEWVAFLNQLQFANSSALVDPETGDTVKSLAVVTAEAKALVSRVEDIKKLGTTVLLHKTAIVAELTSLVTAYGDEEGNWVFYAKYLGEANLALVNNADVIEAAAARLDVLDQAKAAFKLLGRLDGTTRKSVFEKYTGLGADTLLYTKKDVYDAINAKIAAWADKYDLEPENVEYIIETDTEFGIANYDILTNSDAAVQALKELGARNTYVANNEYVNVMNDAAAAFEKDLAPSIMKLNKVKVLDSAAFMDYQAIAEAFAAWIEFKKDDKTTLTVNEQVLVNKANAVKIANDVLAYRNADGAAVLVTAAGEQLVAGELYYFEDAAAATFFAPGGTFEQAYTAAYVLTLALKDIDLSIENNIKNLLVLEGAYVENADGKWVANTNPGTFNIADDTTHTFAAFKNTYAENLHVLLPAEAFKTAKKTLEDKIAAAKADFATFAVTFDAYKANVMNTYLETAKAWGYTGDDAVALADTIKAGAVTTLAHKAEFQAAEALLNAWIAAGNKTGMQEWVPVEGAQSVQYEFKSVIPAGYLTGADSYDEHAKHLSKLTTWAANLATNFKALAAMNTAQAFDAKTLHQITSLTKVDTVKFQGVDPASQVEKEYTSYKATYYYEKDLGTLYKFVLKSTSGYLASNSSIWKKTEFQKDQNATHFTPAAGAKTEKAVALATVIAHVETSYNTFLVENGYQGDATVETAYTDYTFGAFWMAAFKNAVLTKINPTGETAGLLATTCASVVAAQSFGEIVSILQNYYELDGADDTYKFTFNGVDYIIVTKTAGVVTVEADEYGL